MAAIETVLQEECPICLEIFNEEISACVIPCQEGHLICRNCLQAIYNNGPSSPSTECWLLGTNCPIERRHVKCPVCRNVFHLPRDSLDAVYTWSDSRGNLTERLQRRRTVRRQAIEKSRALEALACEVIAELQCLQTQLDNHTTNIRISTLTGSVVSAVGGVIFIVGAGLTFATLGAAAPLMIAGGVVSAVGGSTAGGSGIASLVITKETKKKTEALWKKVQGIYTELLDLVLEIEIDDARNIISTVFRQTNTIGQIAGVIRIARIAVTATDDAAVIAFRVGTVAGRALHIVGMVFAGALLVFDIVSIVWNAVELSQEKPADFSKRIQAAIEMIEKECIGVANNTLAQLLQEEESDVSDNQIQSGPTINALGDTS